jgi:hypothetical protein
MDEAKLRLPAWLPWATTACLAAGVACLVELWMIERARNLLLKDEALLTQSAMKGQDNQLEAERIIGNREAQNLRAASKARGALRVALLAPPTPPTLETAAPVVGAAAWDPTDGKGTLRFFNLPAQAADKDYQLWLEGAGPRPARRCAVFHSQDGSGSADIQVGPVAAVETGSRFLLIEGTQGGSATLEEARAGGSIVLATPLPAGRISN